MFDFIIFQRKGPDNEPEIQSNKRMYIQLD